MDNQNKKKEVGKNECANEFQWIIGYAQSIFCLFSYYLLIALFHMIINW